MRRHCVPRAQALVLFFTLLGGFGLPLLDAAWFHSTPVARPDRLEIALDGQHGGRVHALGCAVFTSATSGCGTPLSSTCTSSRLRSVTGCPRLVTTAIVLPIVLWLVTRLLERVLGM